MPAPGDATVPAGHGSCYSEKAMKTSTTTPRTSRKTTSTAAKAAPAEKKVAAPRLRRATPKKTPAGNGVEHVQTLPPSAEEVRFRAYQIYLHRMDRGDELSDWLQAEQELMAQAG